MQSGAEEEKVFALNRKQLMEAVAVLISGGPEGATGGLTGDKKALKER